MPKKYKYKTSFTFEGKRYQIYADTQKELYKKEERKRLALENGRILVSSNMLLKDWYTMYVDSYKSNVKEITLKNWKCKIEKQLISELGAMPLNAIKPLHLQRIAQNLNGYSADYIKKVKQGIYSIFDKAVENKLINDNPAKNIVAPEGGKTTRRSITEEERKLILATIPDDRRFQFYAVMLYAGLRPSEVAELKGMDIKDGMIFVRGTKTKNATRKVPLAEPLRNMLVYKHGANDYIFKNTVGKKLDESGRQHLWNAFKRHLNLKAGNQLYRNKLVYPSHVAEDLVPYCLRHTFCTDLCLAGVDVRVAQRLMGHASITTTSNIYTHVNTDKLLDAADKLNNLYRVTL